ncbi:peptidase T [Pseudogemmobacter faecipullorum]|uniref:Peptidase T n=1 Tax=Pseudogemmobacter faecipullorum TaxID=2755041 RepID=A0ABS8CH34_9RHOB|nr:peptidase T [Pseudogemmobacter faecipullorum]MCB5408685.1 peptidase T [Pseudogemmobacter faecipullorum]
MSDLISELEARLTRYCAIDSQSDAASHSQPSTAVQLDMARLLLAELEEIGASDIRLTDYGVVLATIPATAPGPVIAFLAHMDTTPQFNATGVKPRVIRGYNGDAISFPDNPALSLTPEHSPALSARIGHDLVTASGTTLLGADDKAGIAIIMAAARRLIAEQPRHGKIRLAFTPDEEIGRGVDPRLPADIGADFAYTFDGANPGEIEYESFSADGAVIRIKGVSIHPGWAKGKMVNAINLAAKLIAALPQATMQPEVTDGREGFIHPVEMTGGSSEIEIQLILRDFEREGLAAKGAMLRKICEAIAATEPRAEISCEITPQYRNMRYWLEQDMTPVELAHRAAKDIGLEPVSVPIRGGTDGSRLTELGLPCPNLFTGMQNIHGPLEWVSLQDMAQGVALMQGIVSRAAK